MSEIAWPLAGHGHAEAQFSDALGRGRLHHAWLLEGPSGVGKSRLAWRMAACLLGARRLGDATLDVDAGDPVVAKLRAGAHPDFRWLAREPNDKGKLPLFIPVEQIRADVVEFLTLRPALGGRRVCVIDALDELNSSGANALLKSVEEPPEGCVLILLHHGERVLLPTIRSRCRRLRLSPLGEADMTTALAQAGVKPDAELLALSRGRPGQALRLGEPGARTAIAAARQLLQALKAGEMRRVGDAYLPASASDPAFHAFGVALLDGLGREAEGDPGLADAWLWVARLLEEAQRDSMDRGQTAAKLITGLQQMLQKV